LIYSTKSENGPVITIARAGDTALVVESHANDSSKSRDALPGNADTLTPPDPTALPMGMGAPSGSSAPLVLPGDLDTLRREGLIIPVAGVAAKNLVDSFDDKRGGTRSHNALDIMAARNTPVLSAVSGSIVKLHNSAAGGLTIYASDPSAKFILMYGHLDSYRPGLKEGERVTRGQIIGFVGSTGNANVAGPHLHFQITRNDNVKEWWKGTPVNPFVVFRPKG
jgi:peptidoglycan LD-endopeptidase LytH